MIATSFLTVYMCATSFKTGKLGVMAVVSLSGLASIGKMVITNFMVDSDFKWLLMMFVAKDRRIIVIFDQRQRASEK